MKNVKPLHARQLHAIKLLAAGTPDYLVAQRIEVSTMTIYRWKRQDEFSSELRRITYLGMEDFSKKLNDTTLVAIDTLYEVMNRLDEPSRHRSKVALGVLNALPKIQEALARHVQPHTAPPDDLTWGQEVPGVVIEADGTVTI